MTSAEALTNVVCDVVLLCLVALIAIRLLRHHPTKRYVVCLAALVSLWSIPVNLAVQRFTGFGAIRIPLPFLNHENRQVSIEGSVVQPHNLIRAMSEGSHAPLQLFWIGLCVWAVGVFIGLARLAFGYRTMRRIVRGATPWDSPSAIEIKSWLSHTFKGKTCPVLVSDKISVPAATAALKPVILLPTATEASLTPDQLRQILVHEASHVTLHHLPAALAACLTSIAFWPIPLIHLLRKQTFRAQEEICDNVASQVHGATCYARTLFEFAQGISSAPPTTSALALLGPETSVESRIIGLLNPRRNRMVTINNWQLAGVASAAIVSMACIQLAGADQGPSHIHWRPAPSLASGQGAELVHQPGIEQVEPTIFQAQIDDKAVSAAILDQLASGKDKSSPKRKVERKEQGQKGSRSRDGGVVRTLESKLSPPKFQISKFEMSGGTKAMNLPVNLNEVHLKPDQTQFTLPPIHFRVLEGGTTVQLKSANSDEVIKAVRKAQK